MKILAALPIRTRLVVGFALAMAVVLAATGAFVYERTRSDLDGRLDGELATDLAAAVAIVRDDGDDLGDPAHDPLARLDPDGFVQVIGPTGAVAGATVSSLATVPVADRELILSLTRGEIETADVTIDELGGDHRIVAERTQDDGVRYYAITGVSLEERDETLSRLLRLLLLGGPIALLLSALVALRVVTAALGPVEAMRRRAAEITESDPGQRLPVSGPDDEIAALGVTLNAMLGRLESAIQHERRFVADASHELRTPLSILQTEVDLALVEGRSPAELRAALSSVGVEVDRLAHLAEDLLVIARADQGRLPVKPEPIEVAGFVAAVLERSGKSGGGRPVEIRVPAGARLSADPLRLEQALTNLLDNAERYGGGAVAVEMRERDGFAELHVLDDGPGFADDVKDRAFQRFARSAGDRSGSGAGLGLAIVDLIAKAHGGEAGIAQRPDGGADVWLRVPAAGAAVVTG